MSKEDLKDLPLIKMVPFRIDDEHFQKVMDDILEDETYIWSRLKYMKDWEQHLYKGKFSFKMDNKRIVIPVEEIKKFT